MTRTLASNEQKPHLCIYHGPTCLDGFAAAWAVHRYFGETESIAAVYGTSPPDVTGRNVVIVDFSYPQAILEEMNAEANSLLVLDHHATAERDIRDAAVNALFDLSRSGAGLAWDYFFPKQARPALLNYVEDYDLWRFALPHARLVHAALAAYDFDFDVWDHLMRQPIESFFHDGEVLDRKQRKDVRILLAATKREMVIGGRRVPVANIPGILVSEAGSILAQGHPFAACYWDSPLGRVFSLRSAPNGIDVSTIAQAYGGGGHYHAASFRAPRGWEGET